MPVLYALLPTEPGTWPQRGLFDNSSASARYDRQSAHVSTDRYQ